MDEDDIQEKHEAPDMGTIVLMLGLYLIVLAFFILLNAMAEVSEDKVEAVSESVAQGFGFERKARETNKAEDETSFDPVYTSIATEMLGIMESYLAIDDYTLERDGQKIRITIQPERFFAPGSVQINPDMAGFFRDMAHALSRDRPGLIMQSETTVFGHEDDGASGEALAQQTGHRATLFTRALIERGVPPSHTAAGALIVEKKPIIRLMVDLHIDNQEALTEEAKRLESLMAPVNVNLEE